MSQAKVDRYKEEKRNRDKLIKKEKRNALLIKVCGTVIVLALVGWVGFSTYQKATDRSTGSGKTYDVDTASLDEFLNNMSVEEATAETEGTTEVAAEEAETEAVETENTETEAAETDAE